MIIRDSLRLESNINKFGLKIYASQVRNLSSWIEKLLEISLDTTNAHAVRVREIPSIVEQWELNSTREVKILDESPW